MEQDKGTRKVLRRQVEVSVNLKVHESSAKEVMFLDKQIKAKTSDVSNNGLGIYSPIYIPEGACLEMELESTPFFAEKKGPVHLVAKVTTSIMTGDKYRVGLQFVKISDEDKEAIINYIKKGGE